MKNANSQTSMRLRTAAAAALALSTFAFRARAAARFAPNCPVPGIVTVPFVMDSTQSSWAQESAFGADTLSINNNLHQVGSIFGNPFTSSLQLHFSAFNLELGYDFLRFYDQGTGAYVSTMTGYNDDWSGPVMQFKNLGVYGAQWDLLTDGSNPSAQVTIDAVTVTCSFSPHGTAYLPITLGERNIGVLLSTNDVVYMKMFAPPDGLTAVTNIAMWSEVAGIDFDLYARCGAIPTPTSYTARSSSSLNQEFIELWPGACAPGQALYIAVNSVSGGGGNFNLVASFSAWSEPPIYASPRFPASPAQIDEFADTLLAGMKNLYGLTEGGFLNLNLVVCNLNQCGENYVQYLFDNDEQCTYSPPRSNSQHPGQSHMCSDSYSNGRALAHESGHGIFGFIDEYDRNNGYVRWCGHTEMATLDFNRNNFCSEYDHLLDPTAGATVPAPAPISEWELLKQTTSCQSNNHWPCPVFPAKYDAPHPSMTPDTYDYEDFEFSGRFSVTKIY